MRTHAATFGLIPLTCGAAAATVSIAVAAITAQATAGLTLLAEYDGATGQVPQVSTCWPLIILGSVPAPFNDDGAVTLGPTSSSAVAYWQRALPPISFDDGAAIMARVRVTSSGYFENGTFKRSGYYVQLRDDLGRWAGLGISSDRVLLMTADQNSFDQTFAFDTTGAYHDYALAFNGSTVEASIDGGVVLTATAGMLPAGTASAEFGDLSVLAGSFTETALVEVLGVAECAPADFNCDGVVNGADLGILLGAWGTTACAEDLNGDGTVDGADLGILLGEWTG